MDINGYKWIQNRSGRKRKKCHLVKSYSKLSIHFTRPPVTQNRFALYVFAILNHQIQPVSEARLTGLTMTSELFHWFTAKLLFFCFIRATPLGWLGGRLTALHTHLSLLNTQTACITINPLQYLPPNSLHIPNSAPINAQAHP